MNMIQETPLVIAAALFTLLWVLCFVLERRIEARFQEPFRFIRNFILPGLVVLWSLGGALGISRTDTLFRVTETLFGFGLVWFLATVLKVLFFSEFEKDSVRARTPRLLVDILRLCFVVIGCLLVYSSVWQRDISPLLTTFGVGSLVLGLALQDTLGNLFAGLSLVFERPISVGDWIQVGDLVGKVRQINWRSVRIVTRELNEITIPNSAIGKDRITNFSNPVRAYGFKIAFGFSYDTAPNEVKDMLRSVALETPGILHSPEPDPRTTDFGAYAVQYELRIFIDDYENLVNIRNELMSRVWYAARRKQISIPYPTTTLYKTEVPYVPVSKNHGTLVSRLLRAAPIFAELSDDDFATLEDEVTFEQYAKGERVITEGKFGEAFYLLIEGECSVVLQGEMGNALPVLALAPGAVFGEVSLLLGKVRNASVDAVTDVKVARIGKEALSHVLTRRPELVPSLAHYAAVRAQEAEHARSKGESAKAVDEEAVDEVDLRARIRRFFGLA
jgi:small-conductance mechanosensitive channel/CRP-like cAMP-binding protein